MKGKERANRYSADFKLQAIKLYKKGMKADTVGEGLRISPKSLYAWVSTYKKSGYDGLVNKTTKGQRREQRSRALINKVIEAHKTNPVMGPDKISGHLARFDFLKVAANTVRKIILNDDSRETIQPQELPSENQPAETTRGRIIPRRKPKKNKPKQIRYFERSTPNSMWQMDIMTFMLKGQYRVYLIGAIDDNSRFIVNHGLYRRQTEGNVLDVLRGGMEKFGCPKEVLTDNGRQFYSWRGKSKFTKFCIKVGIQHVRSRPYHPQTLGKIESFWRNLNQEFLGNTPLTDFEDAQVKIAEWIKYYNYQRVHMGINNLVPSDRFFGMRKQVEQLMKEGTEETARQLETDPPEVKSSMYLIGKIGGREIRVMAKDGEITFNEPNTAAVETAHENVVKSEGEGPPLTPGIHLTSSPAREDISEETDHGRPETAAGGTGGTTAGIPGGCSSAEPDENGGGQVPPADQRAGESGNHPESAQGEDNGGGSVLGAEHHEGSVLQMAEERDDSDEGIAGAGGPGPESEDRPCIEGTAEETGKRKEAAGEGEAGSGGEIPDSAETDRVAERGEGATGSS